MLHLDFVRCSGTWFLWLITPSLWLCRNNFSNDKHHILRNSKSPLTSVDLIVRFYFYGSCCLVAVRTLFSRSMNITIKLLRSMLILFLSARTFLFFFLLCYYRDKSFHFILAQDIVCFEKFTKNLTQEEQQQLLKFLPSIDTAKLPDRWAFLILSCDSCGNKGVSGWTLNQQWCRNFA